MNAGEKLIIALIKSSESFNRFVLPDPDKISLDTIITNLQHYLFCAAVLAMGLWARDSSSLAHPERIGGILIIIAGVIGILTFAQSIEIGHALLSFEKLPLHWVGRIKPLVVRVPAAILLVLLVLIGPLVLFMITATTVILTFLMRAGVYHP